MNDKNDKKVRRLVLASLFAALCTLMTLVIQIPTAMQGYLNLGDCAVLLAAWTLGPWYGGAAAGIGSMLADLLSYPLYAPATLVIKFAMGVAAGTLSQALRSLGAKPLTEGLLSGIAAELIMVTGYFLYACLLLGEGIAAAASVTGNLIQGALGIALALILRPAIPRAQ